MIEKRIKKHLSIARTRLNQTKELHRISKYRNETLIKFVAGFETVKNRDFTKDDLEAFERCENYRKHLLQDETLISYEIFGSDKQARVKDICRNAASSPAWCQFLYYLSKKTCSNAILEIGTNLGISGSYALKSITEKKNVRFITMEGLPQLCEISADQFASIAPNAIYDIRQGLFDYTFPELLKEDVRFDLLFVDGNHQKEPTIAYFKALLNNIHSPAIFVFDDINWSSDMQDAWLTIKEDDRVNFSIDLYKQGIVIIDEQESKKNVHFSLHLAY